MRIRHLSIRNFRGVRELDWPVGDRLFLCLIGSGDSTKSTVLEAIRRLFHPQWNLAFDDGDFYRCAPSNPISITAIVADLPDSFRDLARYGYKLIGWDSRSLQTAADPGDDLEDALRVRLTVGADLEPHWRVVKDDSDDGVSFAHADRARASVSFIGIAGDRHLSWSRGSLLHALTDGEGAAAPLADAYRLARAGLDAAREKDLKHFDAVARAAEATARTMGVRVGDAYQAHIDTDASNVRAAGLSLHDGPVPLRHLGLGSKRVLTTGLQTELLKEPHITLMDEVELGLEPHRIARLLKQLRANDRGQYFVTTHSPVVIRELTVDDLHVTRSAAGHTEIVPTAMPGLASSVQGKIRSHAEAFLASRILVCEGCTEVGFTRGLETGLWKDSTTFSYQGLALIDAHGASKVRQLGAELRQLGFSVAVLADSDAPSQFSAEDAAALRSIGVPVHLWSGDCCLEERVALDIPWPDVLRTVELASTCLGSEGLVIAQIGSALGTSLVSDWKAWEDSQQLRSAIGLAAKRGDWFKRTDRAQLWAEMLMPCLATENVATSSLGATLSSLRQWIDLA